MCGVIPKESENPMQCSSYLHNMHMCEAMKYIYIYIYNTVCSFGLKLIAISNLVFPLVLVAIAKSVYM